jgi:hypothetical protein
MSKFALLTLHPSGHAARRLVEEASALKLELSVLNPMNVAVTWPSTSSVNFEKTLNRVSSVEGSEFLFTSMRLPHWGRQYNAWSLREALWDKSRQALWLSEQGIASLPFFSFRGAMSADNKSWRAFAAAHQTNNGWVLKMNRGQRGVGVHFLKTEAELMGWLETLWRMGDQDFIVQSHWQASAEYRVTVLAGKLWAVLKREGEGKANFAQGGEAQEIKLSEGPRELSKLVEQLAALNADYLSIDILQGPRGLVVNDVNTTPGFEQLEAVTGRNFAQDLWKTLVLG